jgi:ADP-dependent NAD(P)H-hydrate dehydratase
LPKEKLAWIVCVSADGLDAKMKKHDFQMLAKSFRAGRLSLEQFTTEVFALQQPDSDSEQGKRYSKTGGIQEAAAPLPKLPDRQPDSHKGDFGRVLLIGGSPGMAGAIGLAGMGALRAGAGLVKLAVPSSIQAIVAAYSPCYMTVSLSPQDENDQQPTPEILDDELDWASVIVIGPGMGRGIAQRSLVKTVYQKCEQPVVLDADALNALAEAKFDLSEHRGERILTPHPGEFQRLIGKKISQRTELEREAVQLAKQFRCSIVLKGHRTFVTDGRLSYFNSTGNAGLATGGTGDVLSGVIGALLGQRLKPMDAARLGVYWHGLAGDHVAISMGQHSLIASDLIEALGAVAGKW